MPNKSTMPAIEIGEYYEAQQLTRECLITAVSKLRRRDRVTDNPSEVREINALTIAIEADEALLVAKKRAFDANQHDITPPSAEQLDTLNKLVSVVDALNAGKEILADIRSAKSRSLAIFSAIHPDQSTKQIE